MKKFRIGLQLFSVRDEMEKDFEGTLKAVKDMGYDCVEFAGYFGKSAEEVKEILDRVGLEAISVHQNNELFKEIGQPAIDYLKTIGAKYCAIPWYDKEKLKDSEYWEQTKKEFIEYSNALKASGIKMLYHNHDFEFVKVDGKYRLDYIYDELTTDVVSPEFDTCWVHYAGEDPCKYLEKYAGSIDIVHLKDFVCTKLGGGPVYDLIDKNGEAQKPKDREEAGFMFKPVGYGIQNIPAIVEASEKAGASVLIVEQDGWPEEPAMECAKKSIDYLRSIGL